MNGPRIRSDIIDAYIFRRPRFDHAAAEPGGSRGGAAAIQLLQLRRAKRPMLNEWHPIMGHIETGETATDCLWREVEEEVGLRPSDRALLSAWQLEQVHPFFLADRNEIVLSPRFAVEVSERWEPTLNHENDAHRWVPYPKADRAFVWPGQRYSLNELAALVAPAEGFNTAEPSLRLAIPGRG